MSGTEVLERKKKNLAKYDMNTIHERQQLDGLHEEGLPTNVLIDPILTFYCMTLCSYDINTHLQCLLSRTTELSSLRFTLLCTHIGSERTA
jgi:hypothetical protein